MQYGWLNNGIVHVLVLVGETVWSFSISCWSDSLTHAASEQLKEWLVKIATCLSFASTVLQALALGKSVLSSSCAFNTRVQFHGST